jgi:hypothetical protein
MANLNFNANEVEPSAGFEPIPAGKYVAAITKTEMKPTKNGSGNYLELTFTILDGECRNRMVWARLCLNHPNAQTVKIARGELSAICRAVGVMTPRDSVELHNIPVQITVACKKRKDTGEIANQISKYEPKSAAAGVPQQATDNTPPWRR